MPNVQKTISDFEQNLTELKTAFVSAQAAEEKAFCKIVELFDQTGAVLAAARKADDADDDTQEAWETFTDIVHDFAYDSGRTEVEIDEDTGDVSMWSPSTC